MAESRIYTIPLRKEVKKASYKRKTNKAVRAVKEFVMKHMKVEKVVFGEELNEHMWARGITSPPGKVQVEVTKETVKKDNKDIVQGFVNLVGVKKKVVEQKKASILSKDSAGLKDKLQEAVGNLKADKSEESEEKAEKPAKKAPVKKAAKKEEAPKAAPKKEEVKEAPKAEEKAEAKETEKAE